MKKLTFLLCIVLVVTGCGSKELTREEALTVLQRDLKFPNVIEYSIHCNDPDQGRKVLNAGLEEKGLVTVMRTRKMMDTTPLVQFTSKAQPYLLPTPDEDRKHKIQKVKVADEDIVEVTGIQSMEDGKQATVEYKTAYKNVTDFSVLYPQKDYTKTAMKKAHLALYDDGWRVELRK